jgi:hypothetical protein
MSRWKSARTQPFISAGMSDGAISAEHTAPSAPTRTRTRLEPSSELSAWRAAL